MKYRKDCPVCRVDWLKHRGMTSMCLGLKESRKEIKRLNRRLKKLENELDYLMG